MAHGFIYAFIWEERGLAACPVPSVASMSLPDLQQQTHACLPFSALLPAFQMRTSLFGMEKGSGGEGGGCKGRRGRGISRTRFWKACVCVCMCVWCTGEVLSKPFVIFSAVQMGAVSCLVGFPPDGDGQVLALSHGGPCTQLLAGQLGPSAILLPCFGASHTPLSWLQALKK